MQYVVFLIDDQQFAIDLFVVERVLAMVEVTSLPNAQNYHLGAINLHGDIIPVINLRKLIGKSEKQIDVEDHLLICKISDRRMALWVDNVSRLITYSPQQHLEKKLPSQMKGIERAIEEDGKIIFIFNINELVPVESLFST